MHYLPVLFLTALIIISPTAGMAVTPDVPTAIENFVSKLYPEGSHYYWVINQTKTESPQEMIIDILTTLRTEPDKQEQESRFLLLIIQGQLFAAQKIPLGSEVDCDNDEEV